MSILQIVNEMTQVELDWANCKLSKAALLLGNYSIFAPMSTSLPSVGIVILNYNGKGFLEKFLPSVVASTYPNNEIYVADNASTDDSLDFLSKKYPQIRSIPLSQNLGFAEGYNQALLSVKTDYYVLLNTDVEVTPKWLEPIIDLMEQNPQIGICQPKLLSFNAKDTFEYAGAAGGWLDKYAYPFARGRVFDTVEKDIGQYNTDEQIFWASGAALFIKSDVWTFLGGFDGYLFAHQEEIDLCWRAQLAGFKVFYCASSTVFHVGGGTLQKSNPKKTFLNFRNSLIIMAKNLPVSEGIRKIFVRLILDGIFGIKLLLSGKLKDLWAIIKAHFGFYLWLYSKKKKGNLKRASLSSLQGVVNQSIVLQYFLKRKKTFSQIVNKK